MAPLAKMHNDERQPGGRICSLASDIEGQYGVVDRCQRSEALCIQVREPQGFVGRGPLLRINVVLLGFQKRRCKVGDCRRTENGVMRRVRDDREAVWRSQRSVEAGVALSAA